MNASLFSKLFPRAALLATAVPLTFFIHFTALSGDEPSLDQKQNAKSSEDNSEHYKLLKSAVSASIATGCEATYKQDGGTTVLKCPDPSKSENGIWFVIGKDVKMIVRHNTAVLARDYDKDKNQLASYPMPLETKPRFFDRLTAKLIAFKADFAFRNADTFGVVLQDGRATYLHGASDMTVQPLKVETGRYAEPYRGVTKINALEIIQPKNP
ncbi:MAG TPA: hypothetical protein DCY07_07440 [Rhodospirillaceae bacterium]|nr:hypothetical protein [Rhodospirillaceae bacterium]